MWKTPMIPWLVMALLAGGCASPARVDRMTASAPPALRVADTPWRQALGVGEVTGGSDTNPLWKSNVDDASFRQALEDSLRDLGWISLDGRAPYRLTAALESIDQPALGIDMTVTVTVRYSLSRSSDGKPIWSDTLSSSHTAGFSDAPLGVERLRIANEGAVRANIRDLVETLAAVRPD